MNVEEFRNVSVAVSDLADPRTSNKRAARGKYTVYTDEDHATIGKYACQHSNERARKKFLEKYPKLRESTVRNFKKMYKSRKKGKRGVFHV